MKKSFITKVKVGFAVAFATATTFVYGQNYSLTPNDTITVNTVLEALQTLSIQQQNISADTIQFKWKKVYS